MGMQPKVLVIGWDGATFDLLKPWVEAGELPNLERLMDEGVHGRLRSVPNMNSGPAWTTVATGLNPGKHGVYGLVGFTEGSYRLRPLNAADRHGRTIWRRLSEAGQRVVVMNLPITHPAEPVNGVLVAGGDAPRPSSPRFSYPEDVIEEIDTAAGEYILAARLDGLIRAGKKQQALDRVYRMIQGRTRAAQHLMEREDWNLFFVLFTASDSVQHFFWEDLTGGGPHRDAILDVYRRLDDALGTLQAQAGPDTATILLSDHGFGPIQLGRLYVIDFLAQLGLLRRRAQKDRRAALLRWAFVQLEKTLSSRAKEWLLEHFPGLHDRAQAGLWVDQVDWPGTRAFTVHGSSHVWVNTRDRWPQGIVAPGEEYDAVVAQVQRALEQAVDAETGQPAVAAVHRREELYRGPFLERAPDLLIDWTDAPCRAGLAWHGDGERIIASRPVEFRRHPINGSHRPLGIFVASGTPYRRGATIEGTALYDIAPTLLHLRDHPIPTSFDGQILTEALTTDWLQTHPPRSTEEDHDDVAGPGIDVPADGEKEVLERLQALGYTP